MSDLSSTTKGDFLELIEKPKVKSNENFQFSSDFSHNKDISLEEKLINIVISNHPENLNLKLEIQKLTKSMFIHGILDLDEGNKDTLKRILIIIYFLMNDEETPLLLEFFDESKNLLMKYFHKINKLEKLAEIRNFSKDLIKILEILAIKDNRAFEMIFNYLYINDMFNLTKKIIHYFRYSLEKLTSLEIYDTMIKSNNLIYLNFFIKKRRKEIFKEGKKKLEKKILMDIVKNLSFCDESPNEKILDFNYENLIEICIEDNLGSICKIVIKFIDEIEISKKIFNLAIEKKFFVFISAYLKNCRINSKYPSDFLSKYCFLPFLGSFEQDDSFVDAIHIFYQLKDFEIDSYYQRLLCEKFLTFLKKIELKSKFGLSINPILCFILISHFFLISSRIYAQLKLKMISLAEKYRDFALEITNNVDEVIILKNILQKVYYPSKNSLLEILFSEKDFYISFLVTETVSDLVKSKWNCVYNHDYNLWISSTSVNYLISNFKLQRGNKQFIY